MERKKGYVCIIFSVIDIDIIQVYIYFFYL